MITERELLEAIKGCQLDPITPAKREVLADLLIIKDHLYPDEPREQPTSEYSRSAEPPRKQVENLIYTNGDSEFLQAVNGKRYDLVWGVLDELLTVIKLTNKALYNGVLRKLDE